MKISTKALGFIATCIMIGAAANITPHKQTTIATTEAKPRPEAVVLAPARNVDHLLQQYRLRPLFTSKLEDDANVFNGAQPDIAEDWAPLDYQLIGVSRTAKLTTGWFRHKETGSLVSSRRGMRLGIWTLDYLSGTEARLSSNNKTESLKLFQGEEPR